MKLTAQQMKNIEVAKTLKHGDYVTLCVPAGVDFLNLRYLETLRVSSITEDSLSLSGHVRVSLKTMKFYDKERGYVSTFALLPYEEIHRKLVAERATRRKMREDMDNMVKGLGRYTYRNVPIATTDAIEAVLRKLHDEITIAYETCLSIKEGTL
jgi:hypothetical protein